MSRLPRRHLPTVLEEPRETLGRVDRSAEAGRVCAEVGAVRSPPGQI